jgi:phosphodiesterase/alkaline phosphatase D-like protein
MLRRILAFASFFVGGALLGQDGTAFVDGGGASSPFIGGVWAGNVTPTSATVSIRLNSSGVRVRLQVSRSESLTPAVFSSVVTTAATTGNTVKLTVQGLVPDTDYFYGVEVAGVLRREIVSRGKLRTFPLGRASFRVAFASCGDFRAANQAAFPAIIAENPLLFIHMGDLHYSDTNSTVADEYRYNYDNVLGHVAQGPLFRSMPVAYVWDDHDFSGNDSDTTAIGRDTARSIYRERVPHYPLGAAGGTIAQAFTVGRVRFIVTDLRSGASAPTAKDSASKTKMGTGQKAWFKQELINARDNGFPLIVWVCPDPWIAPPTAGEDNWGGYTTERTEIANFIRDNRISNVTIMAGDMHGLAFDDGTNSDYATGGGAPVTVLHAAALTQDGSIKGGPYSGGVFPGSPQYGILEIYDNGGPSVACRFLGIHATEGRKLTHIFSSSTSGSKEHSIVNISTLARVSSGSDSLVSGFVISGSTNRSLLVRAIGPTLSAFGVTDALARPVLSVFQGERLVATNSAWSGVQRASASALTDAFDRAGAFRLVDEGSSDAALILSLPPGAYTVQVRSADGTAGAALLEVYEL